MKTNACPCLLCGSREHRKCSKGKRHNPLSDTILRTLPQQARDAFAGKGRWESRPMKKDGFEAWAVEDDVWSRVWYVPGWKAVNGSLIRTVWRFDDAGDRVFVAEYDVNDANYFQLMEGFGEDARLASWRDYLSWVIQKESDPLDELQIEEADLPSERWCLVFRDFEKEDDKPIAVELIGAKPIAERGGLQTPSSLPAWLIRRFRVNENKKLGAWFVGSYSNLEELLPDLTAQGASIDHQSPGTWRVTLTFKTEGSARTPRTESLLEAARKALHALPVSENPKHRNPGFKTDMTDAETADVVVPPLEDLTIVLTRPAGVALSGIYMRAYELAQMIRGPFEGISSLNARRNGKDEIKIVISSPAGLKDLLMALLELGDVKGQDAEMPAIGHDLAKRILGAFGY